VLREARPGEHRTCPLGVCDGTGWILGPEDVARPCECRERIVTQARLRGVASVIPPRYRSVSFDQPPVTQMDELVVKRVREYCDEIDRMLAEGRGLWFFGDAGTGKTTLAMLVSKTALEARHSVAIYSLPKLLARIRRTFDADQGEQSYSQLFERLTGVDLLHIDDLGAEQKTEWVLEQLYSLINERYEAGRAVVVTTNHDEEELKEQIGERIVSRLAEMCAPQPLYGSDQRWRKGAVYDAPATPAADVATSLGGGDGGGSVLGPLDR
jgi:DNA replication protein DnaC